MFGTVSYFVNYFKTSIMNNYSLVQSESLESIGDQLRHEIQQQHVASAEQEILLINLEKAYKVIKEDISGSEEEI
ncbi:hypothetical protein [Bacillus sp. FJAT-42315]|uniref:hypothetical protein n=1 Tax=Bacillus sp. FJAT-42315 TaxID=2014077 RepID=UPI000C233D27|nr:hypothetical protein [Bacillus sp. FJAT-42315]